MRSGAEARLWSCAILVALTLVVVTAGTASAQQATVARNVNLRPTASTERFSVRLLTPPETLTLLEANPTQGFYHVTTSRGETGWVWGRNITFVTPTHVEVLMAGAPPTPPPGGGYAMKHATCPPVGKHKLQDGTLVQYAATSDGGMRDMAKRHLPTGSSPRTLTLAEIVTLQSDVDTATGKDPVHQKATFANNRDLLTHLALESQTFSEGDLVQITGYVHDTKPGADSEAVNCAGLDGADVHINIGPKAGTPYDGIVVEMIPQLPQDLWTVATITKLKNTSIEVLVVGGLTYDNEHLLNKDIQHPVGGNPQRMSLWEVHPITAFFVCEKTACSASDHSDWTALTAWAKVH